MRDVFERYPGRVGFQRAVSVFLAAAFALAPLAPCAAAAACVCCVPGATPDTSGALDGHGQDGACESISGECGHCAMGEDHVPMALDKEPVATTFRTVVAAFAGTAAEWGESQDGLSVPVAVKAPPLVVAHIYLRNCSLLT